MAREKILESTKKLLGIVPEYEVFDDQILLYVNTTFSKLHQLGVGPEEGYELADKDSTWDDLIDEPRFNFIKAYVGMNVRVMFDPPTSSFALTAMQDQIKELEWRIIQEKENG